jgi:glycosyltransferase involved in cell wall biosynthesis
MRILIANWHRTVQGGVERYLSVLIPELLRRSHSIALLHGYRPRSGVTMDPPEAGLPAWTVEEHGVDEVLEKIGAWSPDVVYLHSLESERLESLLLTRFPAVLFVHDYSRTCPSGLKCHAFPHAEPCRRRFGPACLALFYPRRCGGLNPLTMWQDYQRQSRRFALLLRYQAVLVASVHMRKELELHDVDPERLHVLRLPVAEAIDIGDEDRVPERILFTGRLTEVKGAHYLLRAAHEAAAALNRPLRLTVAGTGPQQPLLEHLARSLQLEVQFKGWVDDRERHQLVRESDLVAVPSLWPEPFGLVGPEAASAGLPAVAYASGGIPEWLIAGVSGELAPADPPTVSGLAAAIVRALGDPDHYRALRAGARSMVRSDSLSEHVAALEHILETAGRRMP